MARLTRRTGRLCWKLWFWKRKNQVCWPSATASRWDGAQARVCGYPRMMSQRSEVYWPVDDAADNGVVNCFYIPRGERRQGIATDLLDAAIEYALAHGAASIDGYPLIDTTHGANSLFVGTVSMFERAGFVEINRVRAPPLMRRTR